MPRTAKPPYRLGVYEQVKRRDQTGAGDAFGAGFLAGLADGAEFDAALGYASLTLLVLFKNMKH